MEEEASRLRLVLFTKFVIFCCLLYPVGPVCVRDCPDHTARGAGGYYIVRDVFGYNGAGSNTTLFPMVTPGLMTVLPPIQTLSPM